MNLFLPVRIKIRTEKYTFIINIMNNFDTQERVRAEVHTVMQENGGKLNMRLLNNLSYLDRCIKEALRLYPSVVGISRKAGNDVKLRN